MADERLNGYLLEIGPSARRDLDAASLVTDELRALAGVSRGPGGENEVKQAAEGNSSAVERTRKRLVDLIRKLEAKVERVLAARRKSEMLAQRLLVWGGVIVLALPVVLMAANLMGKSLGHFQTILNGLTATTFLALMFGPGREIRQAAKDRTGLSLLPVGFHARIAAASTVEELQSIARDLEGILTKLSGPPA